MGGPAVYTPAVIGGLIVADLTVSEGGGSMMAVNTAPLPLLTGHPVGSNHAVCDGRLRVRSAEDAAPQCGDIPVGSSAAVVDGEPIQKSA